MSRIPEDELRFGAITRPSKGGQQVTSIPTPAVCVEHVPTGISVTYSGGRSQVKNKEIAENYLEYILDKEGCLPPPAG